MTNEERLDRLERELSRTKLLNRWLLTGVGLCIGVLVVVWAFGTATTTARTAGTEPIILRANALFIEDENGNERAALFADNAVGPRLLLKAENGQARVVLGITKQGPTLNLIGEDQKQRVSLFLANDDPMFVLFDKYQRMRVHIGLIDGRPKLAKFDENGKQIPF